MISGRSDYNFRSLHVSGDSEDLYTFALRESEIKSTVTNFVYLGVDVTGIDELVEIEGLTPVTTQTTADSSFALYAIAKEGLHLLSVDGDSAYELELSIAGDVNDDGKVDGLDSQLVNDAISSNTYSRELDINRDGVIDGTDISILGINYGYTTNTAPTVTGTNALTHKDLSVEIPLGDLAVDGEGDEIFYRVSNPNNGIVRFAPDGETAIFVPTSGFSGTASFELVADDGYGFSSPAIVEIEVSDAPLTSLDFVERNPRLEVGEQFELSVVADFEDREDVLVPASYLNWSSDDEGVARIDNGRVIGVDDGTTIFTASRDGLSVVTSARVGSIEDPETEVEFNSALAEFNGLDVYPDAVTLTAGVERPILVRAEGVADSPDLTNGSTGTRYFVDNPSVISVDENGLITTLTEGEAEVTVIHGGVEAVIPVNVETPNLGATVLDESGGIVANSDRYQVMIPSGALNEDVEIEITTLDKTTLTTPLPEQFDVYNAFNLDFGESDLAVSAQLAIPAPEGLAPGTEVFFLRDGEVPDETGTWNPMWFVQDSGIVGDDGMVRTSSPPWPAVEAGDDYIIAVPKFGYSIGVISITSSGANSSFGAVTVSAGLATASAMGGGVIQEFILPFIANLSTPTVEIRALPSIGTLPYITEVGVEINPNGIPTATVEVNLPEIDSEADFFAPPVLEQGELNFDEGKPVVYLTGSNFSADEANVDLIPIYYYQGESYPAEIIPSLSESLGGNRYKLAVEVPQTIVLGESSIELVRMQEELTEVDPSSIVSVAYPSDDLIRIEPQEVELTLTAQAFNDTVTVFNALNPEEILETPGLTSRDLVLAKIPVGTGGTFDDSPRDLAATHNSNRAYVSLEDSASLAVIDLMSLQQVDTLPSSIEIIDPIPLPEGSKPRAIVISPQDIYAYVADYRSGNIYILDINSNSDTYHQVIKTINLPGVSNGIHALEISSDGKRLFVTAPGSYSDTDGKIYVVNIDPKDKPDTLEPNTNR